jgi:3-phytase
MAMRNLALALVLLSGVAFAQASARVETTPILSGVTAAHDTAIWVHPTDVTQSLVFGTDSFGGGLYSWGLDGGQREFLAFGPTRAVDVRYGVQLGSSTIDVVLAVTINGEIRLLSMDPATGLVVPAVIGSGATGSSANAAALAFDPATRTVTLFIADGAGTLRQYAAIDDGAGHLVPQFVRSVVFDSPIEALAVDDRSERIFLAIANRGLFALPARDGGSSSLVAVDSIDAGRLGGLAAVAVYPTAGGGGYVIASASQTSRFAVYSLSSGFPFVTSFAIIPDAGAEGATNSRGIDVVALPMGALFNRGLFVTHDRNNATGPNYKLVAWDDIATRSTPPLVIDTGVDPRAPGKQVTKCPIPTSDGGTGDGGTADGGNRDGGSPDGGATDAGGADAGDCVSGAGGGGGSPGGMSGGGIPPRSGSGGGAAEDPKPCGCGHSGLLFPFAALGWLLIRRRERRS